MALGILALAFPASTMALKPVPSQSASLSFDGCTARVVADWANQPGRYKAYEIYVSNDVNGTLYGAGSGAARSGHVDTTIQLPAGSTRNFRVLLWFFNHDGAVVNGALSSWVAADCQ